MVGRAAALKVGLPDWAAAASSLTRWSTAPERGTVTKQALVHQPGASALRVPRRRNTNPKSTRVAEPAAPLTNSEAVDDAGADPLLRVAGSNVGALPPAPGPTTTI